MPGSAVGNPMSFPDDPKLLRRTRHFAAVVLAGEIPEDVQPDISNLLGFAKNFYLQFFQDEHEIEVSGFNREGRALVRPLEVRLRTGSDAAGRLLVSHYLTMAERLDENAETSDELDPDIERDEILVAVVELLDRIANWAEARNLNRLAEEAKLTHGEFGRAASILASAA